MPFHLVSLDELVSSYVTWLEVVAPDHRAAFVRRLKDDSEAAHAEAATFSVLRQLGLRPEPGEVLGKGGVDFICRPAGRDEFAVEVTSVSIKTVADASGLAHADTQQSGSFGQITAALLREAVNKASQMSGYPMARVLVIATEHKEAGLLMGAHGAELALTGTTAFRVRTGDVAASAEVIAPLKDSLFFRPSKDGGVEPARQSISVILLMQIREDAVSLIGLMHPAPAVPFDTDNFGNVHFVRLREWPIGPQGRFGIEWVGPTPSTTPYFHVEIELQDNELRGGD